MHRRKDGRTRVRAARRRWRWSCPANIGESDDSRRKMSDGRVVEDVSGVEWSGTTSERTTATGASKKSGEFVRRGAITHAVAATELRKSQRLKRHAYVMRLSLAREKTPTRSRSVEMEKDAQKWIEVVGWPRMDDTYKMLITSEISVQRYIERWPWPPPVQPSPECKELYRIFLVLCPLRAQFRKSFSTDIIGRSRR